MYSLSFCKGRSSDSDAGVNLIDSGEAIGRRVKDVIANLPFLEVDKKNNKAMYTGILTSYEERLNMVRSFGFNDLEKF